MPGLQWTITALGLFAAMLAFCALAITAHERREPRRILFAVGAAGFLVATIVFGLRVHPAVHIG